MSENNRNNIENSDGGNRTITKTEVSAISREKHKQVAKMLAAKILIRKKINIQMTCVNLAIEKAVIQKLAS